MGEDIPHENVIFILEDYTSLHYLMRLRYSENKKKEKQNTYLMISRDEPQSELLAAMYNGTLGIPTWIPTT